MKSRRVVFCCVFAFLYAGAPAVHAQSDRSRAAVSHTIAGTVVDMMGTPIVDAEVVVANKDSTRLSARTDERGQFRLANVPASTLYVRVRRLGYAAKSVAVRVLETQPVTSVFVELEASAATLDRVVVGDDSVGGAPDHELEAFYERARTNHFGHYITQADIDQLRPNFVSEALRKVPGVQLQATGKAGNYIRMRGCAIQGKSSARVAPAIWVNGVRVEAAELDEVAPAANVAGIEVYPSFAGVPARYLDRTATCGTILVWLRLK